MPLFGETIYGKLDKSLFVSDKFCLSHAVNTIGYGCPTDTMSQVKNKHVIDLVLTKYYPVITSYKD